MTGATAPTVAGASTSVYTGGFSVASSATAFAIFATDQINHLLGLINKWQEWKGDAQKHNTTLCYIFRVSCASPLQF